MNEKKNDKPIEMPARGRPRKKEAGLDQYGNEYEVQKTLFNRNNFTQFMSNSNSILDYIEGSPEKEQNEIRNMYPYRNENDLFTSSYDEEMISPKEVQDGRFSEGRMNSSNEKMHSDSYLKTFGGGSFSNGPFGNSSFSNGPFGNSSFSNSSFGGPTYGSNSYSFNDSNSYENVPQIDPRNGLYNRQEEQKIPYFQPVDQKRVSINTPEPSFFSPRQQYYSSFSSENQIPLSQFRNSIKDSPHLFGDSMIGSNPWYNRKKRKTNPLLWQYSKNSQESSQNIMHPSKYSSLDYIQGVDTSSKIYPLPSKRVDRETNNSILPLFLSSNKELTDEYKEVVVNFKQKITELDFTNVTVQQLKIFMREFGLNHTGKKNELIDRLKSTLHKIDHRSSTPVPKKQEEVKKKPETKDGDDYGFYFF